MIGRGRVTAMLAAALMAGAASSGMSGPSIVYGPETPPPAPPKPDPRPLQMIRQHGTREAQRRLRQMERAAQKRRK